MSTHIGAPPGAIAPTVLMPGDPLRARWIAETYLDGTTCYSEVRGMLGYTKWLGGAFGDATFGLKTSLLRHKVRLYSIVGVLFAALTVAYRRACGRVAHPVGRCSEFLEFASG